MRCQSDGGYLTHLVTTVDGSQLYQCRTGMTVNGIPDPDHPGERNIIGIRQCGLVHDNRGKIASGKYVYCTFHGDKAVPEAMTVKEGIIQLKV